MTDLIRKRVLVTGGAGFLGSHLGERLLAEGCDVLCIDNFYTGTRRNIAPLLKDPYFEVMRHDITFPLYVEVDEIYNLPRLADPLSIRPGADHQDQRAWGHQHAGAGQTAQDQDPAGLDQRGL